MLFIDLTFQLRSGLLTGLISRMQSRLLSKAQLVVDSGFPVGKSEQKKTSLLQFAQL